MLLIRMDRGWHEHSTQTRMQHTIQSFTQELALLRASVERAGEQVDGLLHRAIRALEKRDPGEAGDVVVQAREASDLKLGVHRQSVRILALRQPVASDLRRVMSALLIATDLERIGTHAKSIAERTRMICEGPALDTGDSIPELGQRARRAVQGALEAFSRNDAAKALSVWSQDAGVDDLCTEAMRETLAYMVFVMDDPREVVSCMHFLFICEHIENIGNLATDIAEAVAYCVTGELPHGERPRGSRPGFRIDPA